MRSLSVVVRHFRRRLHGRNDSGQALWLAIILVAFVALFVPIMASQVTSNTSSLDAAVNKHAALAAAEAGIQWYRDELDSYSSYYTYTKANNPLGDPALAGYCGAGLASTCGLSGTNPSEAFTYAPDASQLFVANGNSGAAGSVVLTVTGRAGSPGSYAYVVAKATFSAQSVLDDAYFSNYEVLDPNSDTVQDTDVSVCPVTDASCAVPCKGSDKSCVEEPEVSLDLSYGSVSSVSLWTAMCLYDTYSPNTFLDSLGQTLELGPNASGSPYYGPFQGDNGFSFELNSSDQVVASGGVSKVEVQGVACADPYDFVDGETFDGPVYTNDQLHVCGSPAFNGAPVSLQSGASSNTVYAWKVPGSVLGSDGNYHPAGYTVDTVNCNGTDDDPGLAHGVELNGTQSLPTLNSLLAEYGTSTPPSGTSGTGCTYVGPTMIELVTQSGTTTMDVWSPLSTNTTITTSACSNGQTFSASTPLITGIALPSDGVVYVQNYTLTSGSLLPAVPSDGSPQSSTSCFNPYQSNDSDTSSACYEGDVYVEGELHGQLTIASSANIMVTRDLTYYCADGAGAASDADPASTSACTNSSTPDVLGLDAQLDVLISGNDPNNNMASTSDCSYDGTGVPTNTGTKLGGTSYPLDPAGVWPWLCNPKNVIIDAAVLALQGSFGVENWGTTPYSGYANLNGTDLSEYRGPFGISGTNGYYKDFSYDSRLDYVTPPHVLPTGVPVWQVGKYVVCGDSGCPPVG